MQGRDWNRRQVLRVALGVSGSRSAAWAKSHITRARVTVITDEVGATQTDALAFAKELGISSVELRTVPGAKKEFFSLTPPELRRYAAELSTNKVRVSMLKTSLYKYAWPGLTPADNKAQPDEKRWATRLEDFRDAVAAAGILGTDRIGIFTGVRTANPAGAIPQVALEIEQLIPFAEAAKVRIVIENEPSQNVATAAELKALMNLMPSPVVGFDWDPWNAVGLGEAPLPDGYTQLPKRRIFGVQVKGDSLEGPSALNWRSILDALQKENYQGPVSLATERIATQSSDRAFLKDANTMAGDLLHIVSRLD